MRHQMAVYVYFLCNLLISSYLLLFHNNIFIQNIEKTFFKYNISLLRYNNCKYFLSIMKVSLIKRQMYELSIYILNMLVLIQSFVNCMQTKWL